MCTVLLPQGGNSIAVNKYIISYHISYKANVVFLLLGDTRASEFYVPTFRNRQSVLKRRHIKFRRRGITQKKNTKSRTG